jgi:hypothetical protein
MRTRARTWWRLFSAAFVFSAVGAQPATWGQTRLPNEKMAFTAFVSHEKELEFSKGDENPYEIDSTYARRSDGSTALSWVAIAPYRTGTDTDQGTIIFDPRRLVEILLEPNTKSVTTTSLSLAQVSSRLAEEHACDNVDPETIVKRGSESILGYATIEEIDSFPDEKSQTWVATALDCYSLKETTQFPDDLGGHNENVVLDIREGDPPLAMFSVPTDYLERSPKQVEAVYEAQFPGRTLHSPPVLKKLEESYERVTNLK